MMEVDEDEDEQAGSRARDKHDGSDSGWDPARRRAHSLACRDKPRLTLSEKMEIVRRNSHADREHPEYRTQAQLAKMFGKSRAAISKIMRKGNVDKLSQKTDAGLDPDLKRQPQRDWSVHKARESCHLELEKRVTEYVHEIEQQTGQPCNAAQACKRAVEIAEELGVDTFKTKPGWCSWFDRLLGRQSPASDSSSISERPPTRAIDITHQLEGNGAKQQHLSVSPPSAPPDQTASSSRSSSHIAAAQMPMLMSSFHGDSHALGGATLVRPASLVQSALFSNRPDPSLPALHARNVSALCREYASLLRQAALPICEEQRTLSKKMSSVEALCSRVLYLMALRSTELTQSATSMRELGELRARTRDLQSAVQRSVARADALEARALTLAAAARGGAL